MDAAQGNTHGIEVARCLKKPYRVDDLRRALEEILRPQTAG